MSNPLIEQLEQKLNDDEAFRLNFDRSSPLFHNGITTPVPTSDIKPAPVGMADHANWMDLPEVAPEPEPDYGPAYDAVVAKRLLFLNLKKVLHAITVHTAAILNYRDAEEALAESTDEEAKVKAGKFTKREIKRRNDAIKVAEAEYVNFPDGEFKEAIETVCKEAKNTKMDKAEHYKVS